MARFRKLIETYFNGEKIYNFGGLVPEVFVPTPPPPPSPSPTPTSTLTPTPTPSITPTITPSITPSVSVSPTPTITPTITPTSTETPTPTPTPTPTDARPCISYTIQNSNFDGRTFPYTDCSGISTSIFVAAMTTSSSFCAKQNSIVNVGGTITDLGPCPSPTPTPTNTKTPTPTPSITATKTPTPTPTSTTPPCYYMSLQRIANGSNYMYYKDCNGIIQEVSDFWGGPYPSPTTYYFCAQSISRYAGPSPAYDPGSFWTNWDNIVYGDCATTTPTPTPSITSSITPTPTPTPTTSPSFLYYDAQDCNDPFASPIVVRHTTTLLIGSSVKVVGDPTTCYEILGGGFAPHDEVVDIVYVDCLTCL